MSQLVACPDCKKHLQVPDDLIGKKVQCPECKHTFTAKSPDEEEVKSSVSTTPSKVPATTKKASWDKDDDEDDRPSKSGKKKRQDDDDYDVADKDDDDVDDDRPRRSKRRRSSNRGNFVAHRGGMILAFGLIALIGGFVAGFPVIFGVIAWIMGNADLEEMRQGRMDPEGEGMTQAGRIMGMIATILAIVGIIVTCGFVGCIFMIPLMVVGGAAAGGAGKPRPRNF